VAHLDLSPGDRVLDVCSGTGASALPAACAVGPGGSVIGVEMSERLLTVARAKAMRAGLANVEFRAGDVTRLGFEDGSFDAVVIVSAIFFAPNMEAQVAELLRLVRPGGVLAVTTWGPRIFEPLYTVWRESLRLHRPDLVSDFNPWARITTTEVVLELMCGGGAQNVTVASVANAEPLETPEDWWTVVFGSGLRLAVDQLDPETAATVRAEIIARARGVGAVETKVIFAIARK
jgi:SAM-dependent methyltransferase